MARVPWLRTFGATVLFAAVFLLITRAWRLNLFNPITYWGDALEMASYLGRDYVFNDLRERFFAPFGVEHASSLRYAFNFLFQPNSTLFLICYGITRDTIASVNLYYVLTFPLAFLCAYWVYGRLKLAEPFRFGSATLYALMPYHFYNGIVHLMESNYFLVPLLAYATVLVFRARPYFHVYSDGAWRWSWRNRQDWLVLGLMVFLSSLNEYHQLFFMMLLPVAALVQAGRRRNYRILAGAVILLTAVALSTVAKIIFNRLISEPGLELSSIGTPISQYGEDEVYGLKIIQILLPVSGHHLEAFRLIRRVYDAAHVVNENAMVSLGLFGAIGFTYLIARGVYAIARRTLKVGILDVAALLTISCVLIASIGGIASVVATVGNLLLGPQSILTQIRCYDRIIVFIGFFSYYASSVFAARAVSGALAYLQIRLNRHLLVSVFALPIFLVALWDQVPFKIANSPTESARYASDREFFGKVEAQLPPGALVFQCPFNIHHADVNQSGQSPYNYADGIRPYLNSKALRFTYGGDDGSAQLAWLEKTSELPPERMIERLCEFGFSGILVHRKLFSTPEKAAELEARLSTLLGSRLEESKDKDFSFLRLDEFCAEKGIPRRDLAAERTKLLSDTQRIGDIDFTKQSYQIFVAEVTGMSVPEPWGRWTDGSAARFRFKQALPKHFTLEITANAFGPNVGVPVKVRVKDIEQSFVVVDNGGRTYSLIFETDGTANTLEIIPPNPVSPGTGDTRKLGLALISIKIKR